MARSTTAPISVGIAALVVGALTVIVLDVVTGIRNPEHLRQTISEYGLGSELWVFGFGVTALAFGSASVLVAMLRLGTASTTVRVSMSLWVLGLLVVVLVPKQDWAQDPTIGLGGMVHWGGTIVAFFSIPVAIIAAARPWIDDSRWSTWSRVTLWLGVVSVLTFGPIVYAFLVGAFTPTPWWEAVTLGYVERVLVIAEVIALFALALWTRAMNNSPHRRIGTM